MQEVILGEASESMEGAWPRGGRLAVGLAAAAFFAEGIGTQVMGLALPAIIKDWSVPRAALAGATAIGMVGFAFGAVSGGVLADRIGRRPQLAACLALLGLSTVACALSGSPGQLGFVRFFVGLALGAALPGAASMIAEASPPRRCSVMIALGLSLMPLGGFATGLLAKPVLTHWGWRGLFGVSGGVALVFATLLGASYALAGAAAVHARPPAGAPQPAASSWGVAMGRLVSGAGRRGTLGLWGSFFFTVLSYYSVFSWVPTALSGAGFGVGVAGGAMSTFAAGGLIGGLAAGWVSQRFGSRTTLWLVAVGAAVSCVVLALAAASGGAGAGALLAGIGLLGATVIGNQTTLFALGAFLYERDLRSSGIGAAVGCGRLGAIASSFTGVAALDAFGLAGFFLTLALAAILALACGLLIERQIPGSAAKRA